MSWLLAGATITFHVVLSGMDLAQALLNMAAQAVVSRLTGLLENRTPILFSASDARKGGQFGRKLKAMPDNAKTHVPKLYRNAFLWACANFSKGLEHEVMLLGFGRTEATRTAITAVMKIEGETHSVAPTLEALNAINSHLGADDRNSIILVHNHPEHIISEALALFLGPEPLPSLTDRNTALRMIQNRLQERMKGNQRGNVRFFLVQNDDVAEFSGLNLGTLVDAFRLYRAAAVGRDS